MEASKSVHVAEFDMQPGQPCVSKRLTSILCGLRRSLDLPASQRNKKKFGRVLAIIPGPKAPKHADAFLQRTLEAFQRNCPTSEAPIFLPTVNKPCFFDKIVTVVGRCWHLD